MIEAPLATMNEFQAEAFERAAEFARSALVRSLPARRVSLIRQLDMVIEKASRSALELRQSWHAVWKGIEDVQATDEELSEVGNRLRHTYGRWAALLSRLRAGSEQLAAEGHSLTSTPTLDLASAEVQLLTESLEKDWPWPDRPLPAIDQTQINESRAAVARGEVQDIEDLIRDLQNRVRPAG
jgi:hypothetical protein